VGHVAAFGGSWTLIILFGTIGEASVYFHQSACKALVALLFPEKD
jgi:hypothetical protein